MGLVLGVFDQINRMIVGRTNLTKYEVREKDYSLDKIIMASKERRETNGSKYPWVKF